MSNLLLVLVVIVVFGIVQKTSSLQIFKTQVSRFNWKLEQESQTGFRLQIYSLTNHDVVYDTGVVETNQTSHEVELNITKNQLYEYKVQIRSSRTFTDLTSKQFLYHPSFSTTTIPIWNLEQSRYSFFRSPNIPLKSTTTHVYLMITAYPSGPQEKLLGAYVSLSHTHSLSLSLSLSLTHTSTQIPTLC
jgi:hypothetical protein